MLTPGELKQIRIFSCLNEQDLQWLSLQAAQVRLEPGEYLIHEGEPASFFVLVEGVAEATKEVRGRSTGVSCHQRGDFFGELSILMATAAPASVRSRTPCRFVRLDPQHLQELIRRSAAFSALIMQTLNERVQLVQSYMLQVPPSRVQIAGSRFDENCRDIRTFLNTNRVPYHWIDTDRTAQSELGPLICDNGGRSIIVDGAQPVSQPTVRSVAEALGFQTIPKRTSYETVIIGGGPAGLAAAVYGASEGLRVLLVERKAPGGQAGTSSRIENYLGFPNGISGDDLSQRAFKQARRFGAEIVLTREVRRLSLRPDGTYAIELDGEAVVAAKTAILATGVDWRKLNAEGVDSFIGRGVFYGGERADAPTVMGKRIYIIGAGNSAGQAALFFANYADEVTLLVRGDDLGASMSQYLVDKLRPIANIRVETQTRLVSVEGTDCLKALYLCKNGQGHERRWADCLFVMIGADAATDWLPSALQRGNGYICTGREVSDFSYWRSARAPYPLETNLPGLFCVGDVRNGSIKRVSSSVGEGSMAVNFIHQYLESNSS